MLIGGGQERGLRAGTENVYGIVGLAKAMDLAYEDVAAHEVHVKTLKLHMMDRFESELPNVSFNGDPRGKCFVYRFECSSTAHRKSRNAALQFWTLMALVLLVEVLAAVALLFQSHVLAGIQSDPMRPAVRFFVF